MKDIYLVNYSVKGIKTLDQMVSLSFYKKVIPENPDTQEYNVKGIYGMNGSGKSGIITSVDILKNILINADYLNNPIVQKNLDEMINKKIGELFIEADYMIKLGNTLMLFRYVVTLSRDITGKYIISNERLSSKKAASKSNTMDTIFQVVNGEIVSIQGGENDEFFHMISTKTMNLLETSSMFTLIFEKILMSKLKNREEHWDNFYLNLLTLFIFEGSLHVYLDESDNHRDFIINNSFSYFDNLENSNSAVDSLRKSLVAMNRNSRDVISITENVVSKKKYKYFEKTVGKLCDFLQIFKSDLQGIEIDKKENHNVWICSLIMVYDSYKIHAEYESTGIKKLIKLFVYLNEMVQGGIVFIDEFDSNLHDVYLCALLEYLMEYGKGQLCFTTHNVGPMDILKQHKKSIDFLSVDHKIYPWTISGNYSPSKLYRNGMIEGSPFNVDSIDFISVFNVNEEDE